LELSAGASEVSREMNVLELFSWRVDTNSFRLHVDAYVEDMGWCKASILLGELEDWPETMEERVFFLEQFAEWELIDEGGW
jgi:hypothetical protein